MSESLDDVKRRILTRVNLASLVGESVKLVARSGKLTACCPFHAEDSPSFYLYDDHYHCFGCKAHGDAITWVREREGLSFVETLRHLSKKYGIDAPELEQSGGRLAKQRADATLYQIMAQAQQFYASLLAQNDGASARDYLTKRGFSPASIKDYGFGLTPREPFGLTRHLQNKGYSELDLRAVGLITASSNGSGRSYDFFRARVMLPIHDSQGRVIAFGGRTLDGAQPKYLNSGATALFEKSHTLFGFDKARKKMREKGRAIVVEGYMDTLMLWQQGFDETVACLGTAFTEHHLRLLKNATNNVTLLFDGDSPGQAAALKTVEIALKLPDMYLKAAALSDGEDPDTFVQKHGSDALSSLLSKAADLFDFAIHQRLSTTHQLAIPDLIASELVPWLAKLPDRMQRSILANRIAAKAGLKLEFIDRELQEHLRHNRAGADPRLSALRAGATSTSPAKSSDNHFANDSGNRANINSGINSSNNSGNDPGNHLTDRGPAIGERRANDQSLTAKPLDRLSRDLLANLYFATPGELELPALRALARRELELDEAHAQFLAELFTCLERGTSPAESAEAPASAMDPAIANLIEQFQKDAQAFHYPDGANRAERIAAVTTALATQKIRAQIKDLKARLVRVERTPEGIEEERKILGMIRELQKNPRI